MSDLFRNKFRISSARLQNWDYSWPGAYFITICTHKRKQYFGNISNRKMILSNVGVIADLLWYEIKNHSKNIELGAFVVMPDHIHGILIIKNRDKACLVSKSDCLVSKSDCLVSKSDCLVSKTTHIEPNKTIGQLRHQNPGKNSVSSIIGGYKSAVTKHCNRLGYDFKWQTRFHDHVIRDNGSFNRISKYIMDNPAKWKNGNAPETIHENI